MVSELELHVAAGLLSLWHEGDRAGVRLREGLPMTAGPFSDDEVRDFALTASRLAIDGIVVWLRRQSDEQLAGACATVADLLDRSGGQEQRQPAG